MTNERPQLPVTFRYRNLYQKMFVVLMLLFVLVLSVSIRWILSRQLIEPEIALLVWFGILSIPVLSIINQLLVYANENIQLTPHEIIWTGKFGRVKARIPISSLRPGSFQNYSTDDLDMRVFTLEASQQYIKFTTEINDYKTLANRLLELCDGLKIDASLHDSKADVADLRCTYADTKGTAIGVAIIISFFLVGGLVFVLLNMRTERAIAEGRIFGVVWTIACSGFLCLPYFAYRRATVESIVLHGGRLTWTDYRGELRVDVSIRDVVPSSFSKELQNRIYRYQVSTRAGDVKWDSQISNCYQLSAILQRASHDLRQVPIFDPLDAPTS